MKIGFESHCLDNKIVLLDEAHKLLSHDKLREELTSAQNTVAVGFTGTPYGDQPFDCNRLLGIVSPGDRVLCSMSRTAQSFFPSTRPEGVADGTCLLRPVEARRSLVKYVELRGEALSTYEKKRMLGLSNDQLAVFTTSPVAIMHPVAIQGVLSDPGGWAPKIRQAVDDVQASGAKSLIVSRGVGVRLCIRLLEMAGVATATVGDLSRFNSHSNATGSQYHAFHSLGPFGSREHGKVER